MFGSPARTQALVDTPSRGASYYLLRLTALVVVAGIPVLLWSIANDQYRPVELYFDYVSTSFLVVCALTGAFLAQRSVQIFAPGEPLRAAWQVIRTAAVLNAVGLVLWHVLGTALARSPLIDGNPLWSEQLSQHFRNAGYVVSGPLRMAVLAVGLGLALRALKGLVRPRVTFSDYALLVPVVVFAAYETLIFSRRVMAAPAAENFVSLMDGVNNPFLALLLFQALMIRRSLRAMGGGLIARCWGSFAVAILLTCLGVVGQWATNYGYLPWPYSAVVWFIWIPAAAAYALAPAYQLEAAWALRVVELKAEPREKVQEAERTDAMHPVAGHLPSGKQASTESATVTWEQALSHAPSVLGKLVMVSKCRLDSDDYEHEALKHVPAEIAAAVMRASHMDLFTRWLALSFEEKLKDLVEYLEAVSDPKARKPLLKEDWQRLIPPSAAQAERLLFESDVAVVLELSEE